MLGDGTNEVMGDNAFSKPGEEATAAVLPKNRASCTSVESSSPGMGPSLGGFILSASLRTVRRSFWARGEEEGWVGIGGVWGSFLFVRGRVRLVR